MSSVHFTKVILENYVVLNPKISILIQVNTYFQQFETMTYITKQNLLIQTAASAGVKGTGRNGNMTHNDLAKYLASSSQKMVGIVKTKEIVEHESGNTWGVKPFIF